MTECRLENVVLEQTTNHEGKPNGWLIIKNGTQYYSSTLDNALKTIKNWYEPPTIDDLISLWPSESVTKCDQLGKIEITDEIMQVASDAFCNCKSLSPNEKKPIILYNYRMKAALEAVFAHIANNKEKPNSSIWDSFPPESPILDKQDNDSWVPYSGAEEKKEPKKQTLLEFANKKYIFNKDAAYDSIAYKTIQLISKYIEQSK